MSDDILDKSEFDDEDAGIAHKKGDVTHRKVIPILLRPKVVYPFQTFHLEFEDEHWKPILDEFHEKKSVIGVMYRNEETEDLPPVGRVATSALIEQIHKTANGKYLVKIIPINRFFTNEHLETKPILWAEVSYYWDHPEDDSIIEPLLKEFLPILNRMGKVGRSKYLQNMTLEELREDIDMLSFLHFTTHPKLTDEERLVALWMYKKSLRLEWSIELLENMINERVEKMADAHFGAKNN